MVFKKLANNNDPDSWASRLRRKRSQYLLSVLGDLEDPIRILDVGGTTSWWTKHIDISKREVEVTLLNLPGSGFGGNPPAFITLTEGDARNLSQFEDNSFDLVFSNSVIEHVGTLLDQRAMANEIQRVGRHFFVQTPNRYFPLEPHFLFPFWQFLPVSFRALLLRCIPVGWGQKQPTLFDARIKVEEIRLLTRSELRRLFPGALIQKEKLFGMTKSYMVLSTTLNQSGQGEAEDSQLGASSTCQT